MISTASTDRDVFRHEALFYADDEHYVDHTTAFIRDGLAGGEAVMVAVPPTEEALIRSALGHPDEGSVRFTDMTKVGRNPLRIIPMWRDFVDEHEQARPGVRGIGQPIWAGRTPEELVEAQRHESLINLAFRGAPATILCPYDLRSLDPGVIEEAGRSHPVVVGASGASRSETYRGLSVIDRPFEEPLGEPPTRPEELSFESADDLRAVRDFVSKWASAFGLAPERLPELVLTVNEVVTNSLRHAQTGGTVRAWTDGTSVVLEVRDRGRIDEALIGRQRPPATTDGGFGLWIVNQLCDLVEIRSVPEGSVVRLRMGLSASA